MKPAVAKPRPATAAPARVSKKQEAHRIRAGAIGLLACCSCTYPLERHGTSTFHAEDCAAHRMTLSAVSAGAHYHLEWTKSGKAP